MNNDIPYSPASYVAFGVLDGPATPEMLALWLVVMLAIFGPLWLLGCRDAE